MSAPRIVRRACAGAAVLLIGSIAIVAEPQVARPTLPFTIELGEPFRIPGAPGLQSFAHAMTGDRVLLVGGRSTGLHGFELNSAFKSSEANDGVWVVDLAARTVAHSDLSPPVPTIVRSSLNAANAEFVQVGDQLYVAGGYGVDTDTNPAQWKTFDRLSVIDVPALTAAVVAHGPVNDAIRQLQHEQFRVSGGEMFASAGRLFLIFGHDFQGRYSGDPAETGAIFRQSYTEQVRVFRLTDTPLGIAESISIPTIEGLPVSHPYHRRDLTVAPLMTPDGKPRIGVYGGVFQPGTLSGHLKPVYIDNLDAATPTVTEDSFEQLLNQYSCPSLAIWNQAPGDTYTLFFGGISEYGYDTERRALTVNAAQNPQRGGMVFLDTISGIHQRRDGTSEGFVLPSRLPALLGAGGALLLTRATRDRPILLSDITAPVTIGYLYGGIVAPAPLGGDASGASDLFIPVVLKPGATNVDPMPPRPERP
jgi:hypothetical protein